MRNKVAKLSFLVVFVNIVALFYSWRLISKYGQGPAPLDRPTPPTKPSNRHISKLVTVILRSFELQENDVTQTVESFLSVFPNIQVLIICDDLPYPPLDLTFSNVTRNVKLINLSLKLDVPYKDHYPLFNIKTRYSLFVPDSTRISSRHVLQSMINDLNRQADKILAVPFVNTKPLKCLGVKLNLRQWTLGYQAFKNESCDAIGGKHAIMVETPILRKLPDAFMVPFPEAFYIQTAAQNMKVRLMKDPVLQNGKPLLRSHHAQWKYQKIENNRQRRMFDKFALKKVVKENGNVLWYGCSRETPRCFGTVVDSMPSYLYRGKWTPPCCLANLRTVARHVFEKLDESGVRYWLDGGSLLGAMRSGDVLPWDYDVDVGINRDDIPHCDLLTKARNKPLTDNKGYVWEKATEGEFFRVQYSKINRIYVNLFPFFSKNGTMTKDMWFTSHKNMEFPDHFLHPMSSIDFVGKQVPCPNNIRDFLELKYGQDVIENPQYPDPRKLKFT